MVIRVLCNQKCVFKLLKIHIKNDILRVRLSAQPFFLSQILTRIRTAVGDGLQKYCYSSYTRGGVNQMCILRNSKKTSGKFKGLGIC